jgi:CBS domain-containing protein
MYARTVHQLTPSSPVRSAMAWPVATIARDANLTEVAEALAADEIGALCVLENGSLAGIVSERDVVAHIAAGADVAHLTAGEVMSVDVVTVHPEESVVKAARMMLETQVRHLPVLDGGLIAGIVSIRDLLEVLAVQASDGDVVLVRSRTRDLPPGSSDGTRTAWPDAWAGEA